MSGHPACLEVTPAMIAAGRATLFEDFTLGGDYEQLVEQIFYAMALESPALAELIHQSIEGLFAEHAA